VENGEGESECYGADGDEEKKNEGDFFVCFHAPKSSTKSEVRIDQTGQFLSPCLEAFGGKRGQAV
jgi:hypothetical protein